MSSDILFEQPSRGDVWRLEVSHYQGRDFGNWRKWYQDGDTLKPTRQGVTIPLERLPDLAETLASYLAANAYDGRSTQK